MTRRRWRSASHVRPTVGQTFDRATAAHHAAPETAHAEHAVSPLRVSPLRVNLLTVKVAHASMRFQLHQVRLMIRLVEALKAAVRADDDDEIERLCDLEKSECMLLEAWAFDLFRARRTMPKEELEALLATGGAPS